MGYKDATKFNIWPNSHAIHLELENCNEILDCNPHPVIILDDTGTIIYENRRSFERVGGSLVGKRITDFIHQNYHNDIKIRIKAAFKNDKLNFKEVKLIDSKGNVFDAEVVGTRIKVNGKFAIMSVYRDITNQKEDKKVLAETENKYKNLVEKALVGVFMYKDNRFTYINPRIQKRLGYSLEELNEIGFENLIIPEDRYLVKNRLTKLYSGDESLGIEIRVYNRKREILEIEAKATAITDRDSVALIGTVVDITERKKTEAQVHYLAYYDTLTGLPNRNGFDQFFNEFIAQPEQSIRIMSLILLDLDRFGLINDTFGHRFGDILLQKLVKRLKMSCGEQDLIARYSGDEFVIVLIDNNVTRAKAISSKIIQDFSKPFVVNGEEIYIAASMGIVEYPRHGYDLETLMKNADSALNFIKQNGRNNFKIYNTSLTQGLPRIVQLERDMRKAIERNELILHYQPLVSLSSGKIIGTEALIRWEHPQLGLIPPSEFIPLAEANGLIVPIGQWVLKTACKQNKIFHNSGLTDMVIAINISRRQFKDLNFTKTLKNILRDTELEPRYLELEITESLTQDIEETLFIIKKLKEIGVRIAIDDFGTGYSSLSILKYCPIDTLKIDKSFIQDVTSNGALVKTIIDMAHTLKFNVVAEGIENESQYLFLKRHHCEVGQGFFFSSPQLVTADFINSLRNRLGALL